MGGLSSPIRVSVLTAALICLSPSSLLSRDLVELVGAPKVYCRGSGPLLTGECTLGLSARHVRDARAFRKLRIVLSDEETLLPMYPVVQVHRPGEKSYVRCLFRLPVGATGISEGAPGWKVSGFELPGWWWGPSPRRGRTGTRFPEQGTEFVVVREPRPVAAAESDWRAAFKAFLWDEVRANEDHEMELLQYLRWFGGIPARTSTHWKKSPFFDVVFMMSGMNDLRAALPADPKGKLKAEPCTEDPPAPIVLPQVEAREASLGDGISPLSRWSPRSCYYVEWPGVHEFLETLSYVARQFEAWSPGTYPRTASALVDHQLERLGLTKEFLEKNQGRIGSMALAGWDPYFQSGTNILLLLETEEELPVPGKVPYMFRSEGAILLSTGEELLTMSQKAHEQGKSLRQVDNFRYARDRLNAGRSGEKEKVFIYLSDYWFTNFVSPRWVIQTRRRNELDARIRLASLLKIVWQRERRTASLPSLAELRSSEMLPREVLDWMLAGLSDGPEGITHARLGGLYRHPPIDTLPFPPLASVSLSEKKDYERFKRLYGGRWRKMDPVAFQVVNDLELNVWKSRLYISPISNRSQFAMMSTSVPQKKLRHRFRKIDQQAMGISLAINTHAFRFILPATELPDSILIQAMAFDFAPRSVRPSHWLEEPFPQDELSFYRVPVAVVLPDQVLRALPHWLGGPTRRPSAYEGLEIVEVPGARKAFPVMVHSVDGLAAVGLDPGTLVRIRDGLAKEESEAAIPCDLRLFVDLKNGYMFRRKVLQEAVKNRAIATWRRENRLLRIRRLLGIEDDRTHRGATVAARRGTAASGELWLERLSKEHVFPRPNVALQSLTRAMPRVKGGSRPPFGWFRASAQSAFPQLPDFLRKLRRVDAFVCVEPNALYFENHYAFFPSGGE